MKISAFIPIKKFSISKERLSNILTLHERSELAELMAIKTISTLVDSNLCDSIYIVTNDKDLKFNGTKTYFSDLSLNESLEEAIKLKNNNDFILIMHADLPKINNIVLQKLMEVFMQNEINIVSDLQKKGTNCLIYKASMKFNFHFGIDSYSRFIREFKKNNLSYKDININAIQDDLDSEEDYFKLIKYING
ncbi:MAG: hypothetical protein CMD68_01115 [Gammaproteobacteria bacterium]|nr:hypothetical protein [Gammaproteobacteria bacterium]|tara:strand:- start:140 stop:715 length:576 start_codon:yes stop_codon:yes gene_type:complete